MENRELLEIFFSEAEDLLQRIEKNLLTLETRPEDPFCLQELFRAVHTMKSSAAMVGFDTLSEYAHLLENLLDRLRSGKLKPTPSLISQLLSGQSLLRLMVDRAAQGETPLTPQELQVQKEQMGRFLGLQGLEPPPSPASTASQPREGPDRFFYIGMRFREDLFSSGQDPLLLLRELKDMGELLQVKADLSRIPPLPQMDPYTLYLSWKVLLKTREPLSAVEEVFCFLRDDHPLEIREVSSDVAYGADPLSADKRIGDLLLEEGIIEVGDIRDALQEQKKIGQVLVEQGKVSEKTLSFLMAEQERSRTKLRKSTIRIETRKLDDLANAVEELSVNLSRVAHELENRQYASSRFLQEEMDRVEKNLREIREHVMHVRMFPLEGTFQRLQRMVRDLTVQVGKEMRMEIRGADTELDKDLIEHITDPLKHLLRNAVDHGLEPPEERRQKGKPPQGLITLEARQREGRIMISLSDDGRGLDLEAIRAKAVEKGLLSPTTRPTAAELTQMILLPGFSTSSEVSDLSGRGVGLDVVRDQISQIGGTVEIASSPGEGTTFTLSIPLTLALLEGLRIEVGGETYLVPVSAVLTVRALADAELKTIEGKEEMIRFEDRYIPAVRLDRVLGLQPREGNGRKIALILDSGRRRFGLLVDQILETRQVVIKSLETHFRPVPGVAGGAILGDGSVCLILDVYGLEKRIFEASVLPTSEKGDSEHNEGPRPPGPTIP